jgi:hypothetical protein
VLIPGFYAVTFVLMGGPYETTGMISVVLALLQAAVLCTPDVLSYVFGKNDAVASH